jgi:hypothetical protein
VTPFLKVTGAAFEGSEYPIYIIVLIAAGLIIHADSLYLPAPRHLSTYINHATISRLI